METTKSEAHRLKCVCGFSPDSTFSPIRKEGLRWGSLKADPKVSIPVVCYNTIYHTSTAETDFHVPWNPARRHSTEEES